MVFSSIVFLLLFLPMTLSFYFLIKREFRNLFLLFASLLFYFWGEGIYILVMLLSMTGNYILGIKIQEYKEKNELAKSKKAFFLAIGLNLGLLIFFKYCNFLFDNISIVSSFISGFSFKIPKIHLPIGISFYSFQAISYIVDVYRKEVVAQKNMINYSMYIGFFPQLIAGPIVRYQDIEQQIEKRSLTLEKFSEGVERFIFGLGKKVLIANNVGIVADYLFDLPYDQRSLSIAWVGMICYSLQIFFDFSGYSDMAIGLGKMFGFDFLENFQYPYISRSIKEFWKRWHISLSTWLRDYLFLPVAYTIGKSESDTWHGIKIENLAYCVGILVTWFLGGLWHGANWTFVAWGVWHGIFLILERIVWGKSLSKKSCFLQHLYALLVILFGWVLFRSDNFVQALEIFCSLLGFYGFELEVLKGIMNLKVWAALILGLIFSIPVFPKIRLYFGRQENSDLKTLVLGQLNLCGLVLILILCLISLSMDTYNPFIYFRF